MELYKENFQSIEQINSNIIKTLRNWRHLDSFRFISGIEISVQFAKRIGKKSIYKINDVYGKFRPPLFLF